MQTYNVIETFDFACITFQNHGQYENTTKKMKMKEVGVISAQGRFLFKEKSNR